MTDRTITLAEPDGASIDVTLVSAGTRAGLPSATFELDEGSWERVEASGLLHADPARSRSAARPFDKTRPVQVEAVLDPVAAIDGVDDLADRLLSARVGDPLLSTEAWWALSATQEVDLGGERWGTLHEGIAFEHPSWLRDAAGSVGLEEAWARAMEMGERLDLDSATPMLDLVRNIFDEQGWEIDQPDPEHTVVHASVVSAAGDFDLYVRTDEEKRLITAFAVLLHDVPSERVTDILELAARLNGRAVVGSYEADADTGLLTFKSGIDLTAGELNGMLARNLIGVVLIGGERANALFAAVAAGELSPADAAERLQL